MPMRRKRRYASRRSPVSDPVTVYQGLIRSVRSSTAEGSETLVLCSRFSKGHLIRIATICFSPRFSARRASASAHQEQPCRNHLIQTNPFVLEPPSEQALTTNNRPASPSIMSHRLYPVMEDNDATLNFNVVPSKENQSIPDPRFDVSSLFSATQRWPERKPFQ